MALFDGISKHNKGININVVDVRYFYYKVTDSKPLKILLSTSNRAINFLAVAKF
jgi:hypothetical protein